MGKNKSTIRLLVLFGLFLALLANTSFAQGLCDIKSFALDKIKGKVVSDGPHGYEPIDQAKVELWRVGREDDVLVVSTSSDVAGFFELNNIKRGRYRLQISKWDAGFVMNFAVVNVVKRVKKSDKGKLLLFRLGVEVIKPCGGGEIFLITEKPKPH
jgi:hypothetical protein